MKLIYILVDYRGQFYSSVRSSTIGYDLSKLKESLIELGYECQILSFKEVIGFTKIKDSIFIYQSSEDRELFYKGYIQDILLYIKSKGGVVIPDFDCFNAHHNKLYQELILKSEKFEKVKVLKSNLFGTFEELQATSKGTFSYPCVVKGASGSTSKSVYLASNHKELLERASLVSKTFNIYDFIRFSIKKLIKKGYIPESLHRKKFIIQEFIPGLEGDFKVLVFGNKYYVLQRFNRKNDFRASGSGKFKYPDFTPSNILDAAKEVFERFESPCISLDLALDNSSNNVFIIELQFLMFGTITLEKSTGYYFYDTDSLQWVWKEEKPELEKTYAIALNKFLK